MTVNALQPSAVLLGQQRYTQNDLMVDPLIVLRCDRRVYRSGAPALVRGPFTVVRGPFIVKLTHQLDKSWKACDVFKLWVRCFPAYIWFRKNPLLPSSSLLKYFIWNWVRSASMNLNVCVCPSAGLPRWWTSSSTCWTATCWPQKPTCNVTWRKRLTSTVRARPFQTRECVDS